MHCSKELRELLVELVDPNGGEVDKGRLAELLKSDAEALAYYVEFMELHAQLEQSHTPSLSMPDALYDDSGWSLSAPSPAQAKASRAWRFTGGARFSWLGLTGLGALAASAAIAAFALRGGTPPADMAERTSQGSQTVVIEAQDAARVVRLTHCQWVGDSLAVNDYVLPGGAVNLTNGVAELQLADGATVLVEGPTNLVVEASDSAFLQRGRITCSVQSGLDGFTVRTPLATIVNLGSEFGVSVEPDGATEAHVAKGMIGFQSSSVDDKGEVLLLNEREGARLSGAPNAKPTPIKLRPRTPKEFAQIESVLVAHPCSGLVRSHSQGMLFGGHSGKTGTGTRRVGTSTYAIPEGFGDSGPIGLANVLLFRLPSFADAASISDAQFEFTYKRVFGNPGYGVDLYGLGYFNLKSPRQDWYYAGERDQTSVAEYGLKGRGRVALLGEKVLTPDSQPGRVAINGPRLTSFIRSLYRSGAERGDVVVLRLSPNSDLRGESFSTGYQIVHPPVVKDKTEESELAILRIMTTVRDMGLATSGRSVRGGGFVFPVANQRTSGAPFKRRVL